MTPAVDLIVVGAGIVGLAHAWAAVQRGWRVAVLERDAQAVGASVRNFGFITVTGQGAGSTWARARRSRDVWAQVAPQAGIEIVHEGLWLLARRPAAWQVLQAFAETDMGLGCNLHAPSKAPDWLNRSGAQGALYSPHELRVESRTAIPQLAAWLAEQHGVHFAFGEEVLERSAGGVVTNRRSWLAPRVVVCPGTGLQGLARQWLAFRPLRLTRLQMLRWQPERAVQLNAALMSDLSLVRYAGYAALPEAEALRQQLYSDCPEMLAAGVHLIAVQSADGSLVVGDSHHDDTAASPFSSEAVDELVLRELRACLAQPRGQVLERWIGHYPIGLEQDALIDAPDAATRLVLITSGTGASTAFAIAEEVIDAW
jgi:FAD dependent oxidoreductase TIGR03364